MMPDHFYWGGWWVFPIIMPIIMLVVALSFLYFLFGRAGFRPPWSGDSDRDASHGRGESESPMEILKKRYAKGEITKDEFERIKKDLVS